MKVISVDGDDRAVIITSLGDAELDAVKICMDALRDLDRKAAARAAAYVAERYKLGILEDL
jgi:hypothetical protein